MNLNISLLPWQQEVWQDNSRFKVIAAGRRCGKSRYAGAKLITKALEKPNCHVWYVGLTQAAARDIMWSLLHELGGEAIKSSHINNLQITMINGSKITLKGSDKPESMRGISLWFLVMDEYAFMKQDIWEVILRPALADQQGDAVFIGTPAGRNHFYEMYKSCEDMPNWKSWHFTSYDNPLLPQEELKHARETMSTFAFNQEFMASFEARESELFKEEWIKYADERPKGAYQTYIAIDLAGFEEEGKKTKGKRDQTAIAVVHASDSGWFVETIITGRWTLKDTANVIFETVRKYDPISVGIEKGIAKQAVMSPLMDLMRQRGKFFVVKELTHGNKKKTDRILWALQGRFEHGKVTIKKAQWNHQFLDQLFQFPSTLTNDDTIDALAYIDQLATITYRDTLEEDTWEPLDEYTGY